MQVTTHEFAGLQCRIVDQLTADQTPDRVVVLCHGFGAPGTDLVDLGPYLMEQNADIAKSCRFVFPQAPLDLANQGMPGSRAWWLINMARLAEVHQTQSYEELTSVRPDGLLEASEQLFRAVEEICAASQVSSQQLVLGGFSQGAMVTTDVVLRHGLQPAGLIQFSGTLLCQDEWRQAAADHPGCPVFQSHGRQDPVLPFEPATWLRDLMTENGFDVTFCPFDGPHTIPMPALAEVQQILLG